VNTPEQEYISQLQDAVLSLTAERDTLRKLCRAAYHALRSYEHGNSATALAAGVADEIEAALAKASGQ